MRVVADVVSVRAAYVALLNKTCNFSYALIVAP